MTDSRFTRYCGRCLNRIQGNTVGSVLSCGDFLCNGCETKLDENETCPLCKKKNVQALKLNNPDLPEEVSKKLSSTTEMLETLYSTLEFQVKSYKRLARKLLTDRSEMQRKISDLEEKLRSFEVPGRYPTIEMPRKLSRPASAAPAISVQQQMLHGMSPEYSSLQWSNAGSHSRESAATTSGFFAATNADSQQRQGSSVESIQIQPAPSLSSQGHLKPAAIGGTDPMQRYKQPAASRSLDGSQLDRNGVSVQHYTQNHLSLVQRGPEVSPCNGGTLIHRSQIQPGLLSYPQAPPGQRPFTTGSTQQARLRSPHALAVRTPNKCVSVSQQHSGQYENQRSQSPAQQWNTMMPKS